MRRAPNFARRLEARATSVGGILPNYNCSDLCHIIKPGNRICVCRIFNLFKGICDVCRDSITIKWYLCSESGKYNLDEVKTVQWALYFFRRPYLHAYIFPLFCCCCVLAVPGYTLGLYPVPVNGSRMNDIPAGMRRSQSPVRGRVLPGENPGQVLKNPTVLFH